MHANFSSTLLALLVSVGKFLGYYGQVSTSQVTNLRLAEIPPPSEKEI
jgi:hypothetical protein